MDFHGQQRTNATHRSTPGLDARTTRTGGYALSQRIRKRAAEIFGWCKTVGGLAKKRVHGVLRTEHAAHWVSAAYNLLRMSRLLPARRLLRKARSRVNA
jgi:hypothetical protein